MFNELVKNFETAREYLREFYIYGFKSRERFDGGSGRLYDDMRRRMESWLGEYAQSRRTPDGKSVFLSIDSRGETRNPLYRAFLAKSFTDGDITLHFALFDIFRDGGEYTLNELSSKIDGEYLSVFPFGESFDISTLRKKLNEYVREGLVAARKAGNKTMYSAKFDAAEYDISMLEFFSEVSPCGIIGAYLLDKRTDIGGAAHENSHCGVFSFKHHYITQALDSEILCALLDAISDGCAAIAEKTDRHGVKSIITVLPLQIFVSVSGGRQYLAGYDLQREKTVLLRLDYIKSVRRGAACDEATISTCMARLECEKSHIWGASRNAFKPEHIEFTVAFDKDEEYVFNRLQREKRCGSVRRIDEGTARFWADVYDVGEVLPWMRTFIGRIVDYCISDETAAKRFADDLAATCALYGVETEGGNGAV